MPPHLQMKSEVDIDESVRHRVAYNPKATREVSKVLSNDECEPIREQAKKRLKNREYN
jgi:hypothetical protein